MSYVLWRSDSPASVAGFMTIADGLCAFRAALAAVLDGRVEWCLVHASDDGRDWETVVCGHHGDPV